MNSTCGPVLAADGTPLKKSLARALRMQKLRALMLVAPLMLFIVITFLAPIADMLFRSVENAIVADTLPETIQKLSEWDPTRDQAPEEAVFETLYIDVFFAAEEKKHTRLGTRLNYELTGISSLFRKSGRRIGRFPTDIYAEQFISQDSRLSDPTFWVRMMNDPRIVRSLPLTARTWTRWTHYLRGEGDDPSMEDVENVLYAALFFDLRDSADGISEVLNNIDISNFESIDLGAEFEAIDEDWVNPSVWRTIYTYSPKYTSGYFLNAVDLQKGLDGPEVRPENQRIYLLLFQRTLVMSFVITVSCILLGYPVAWLLANLSTRTANLLLILVLLPFWTSLLVRTSAWKVMLQQQGVINDTLVWLGLIDDANRLIMINNQFGTIVAMTHILLPFMILPLYSVMQTIPPSYVHAAKSLGATNWTAFWRVYFPQTVPGIGAGSILVFILSIGYYITPEIVGGTTGTFISNRIAYHISSSLNWGLAAALGTILLAAVLILYWAYDKIIGMDNMKLGG